MKLSLKIEAIIFKTYLTLFVVTKSFKLFLKQLFSKYSNSLCVNKIITIGMDILKSDFSIHSETNKLI